MFRTTEQLAAVSNRQSLSPKESAPLVTRASSLPIIAYVVDLRGRLVLSRVAKVGMADMRFPRSPALVKVEEDDRLSQYVGATVFERYQKNFKQKGHMK